MSSFFATLSGLAAPFSSLGVTVSGWRSFGQSLELGFECVGVGLAQARDSIRRFH
jgi:hypothetical protein